MMSDTTVIPLGQPDAMDDPLTVILRSGARRLLAQAVEAEAKVIIDKLNVVPAKLPRSLNQAILPSLALEVVDDLVDRGLPHVREGGASEVLGHDLIHCRTPARRRLPESRPEIAASISSTCNSAIAFWRSELISSGGRAGEANSSICTRSNSFMSDPSGISIL